MKVIVIRTQREFLLVARALATLNSIQLVSRGTLEHPYVKIISRFDVNGEQIEYIYQSLASRITPSIKNKLSQTYNYIFSLIKHSK